MLHTDGYVLYSNIVFLKKDNAPNILFVTPNPFVNYFNVRFSRTPSGPVTFTLYDAASKMVMRQIQPGGSISYNINNQFGIANGAYLLVVTADGQRFTHKLLKKLF